MQAIDLIPQIGIGELARLVEADSDSAAAARAAACLPRTDDGAIAGSLAYAARAIAHGARRKAFLVQPEIAFIEAMAREGYDGDITVCLARELDERARTRIERNVPEGAHASFVAEGSYPDGFFPRTGIIVAFGVSHGDQVHLPATAARIADTYADFAGEKVLVDVAGGTTADRPIGWVTKPLSSLFTHVIR